MTEALETEYKEQECEQLNAKLELSKVSYQTTIDQLKTENEKLKNTSYVLFDEAIIERDCFIEELQQALAKVKEVAEKQYHTKLVDKDCINCDESFAQILQECERY